MGEVVVVYCVVLFGVVGGLWFGVVLEFVEDVGVGVD